TVEYLTDHRDKVKLYGLIAAGVLIVGGILYFYTRNQATARAEALSNATRIEDAVISPTPQPPRLNFATEEEKAKARTAAYTDIATKFNGSKEGAIAQLYLA